MRIQIKPAYFFLVIAAAAACFCFFIDHYRHRAASSNRDLVALLPRDNRTLFFADFALLRHAGMLKLLNSAAQETEYKEFVRETHFDYAEDIDAIAGSANKHELLLLIRGQFDWPSLRDYAARHGGICKGELCRAPTSQPGRWASFWPLQSDVMALLLGPPTAKPVTLRSLQAKLLTPDSPVWIELSPALLRDPSALPDTLRVFVSPLQAANSATFSIIPAPAEADDAFKIRLNAGCVSPAAAQALANQLQLDTKLLKLELAREREPVNPAGLTGLLVAGEFHAEGDQAIGTWPVSKALLRAIE